MAKSSKIRVMLSSRCNDQFPLTSKDGVRLSDLRLKMKKEIENAVVLGRKPYEVWINEDAAETAELDSWDECMRQARDCDILVALYNGNAGWTGRGEYASVGICHAEFMTAYSVAPGKVSIVDIFERDATSRPSKAPDRAFQTRMEVENRFQPSAKTPAALEEAIRRTISAMTVKLVQRGVSEAGRGRRYLGPALDWNRLNYAERSGRMIDAIRAALGAKTSSDRSACVANVENKKVLFRIGAVPDAMSVAAAREMVGQPHLRDDELSAMLAGVDGGPVHLVACHKGATETQAQRMLGFPNATVVSAPFGVYVVDPVQAVQIVLIANCADEASTRLGVQRLLEWLPQSQQGTMLVRSAAKRKRIVAILATKP
ncbi:hypothetical protein QMZ05_02200 [Bradyrhizobium sp. INPA03-11B]|uniref:hypothetical protein n=1 Tax=Bradyrhizobium sp. INPA03-11B TaxID=418598 RepID=UPI00338D55AA